MRSCLQLKILRIQLPILFSGPIFSYSLQNVHSWTAHSKVNMSALLLILVFPKALCMTKYFFYSQLIFWFRIPYERYTEENQIFIVLSVDSFSLRSINQVEHCYIYFFPDSIKWSLFIFLDIRKRLLNLILIHQQGLLSPL